MKTNLFIVVFCASALTAATAAAQEIETILVNGKILTVDPQSSIRSALAIREGRIAALGTDADIRRLAGPRTRTIDLQGRTVIPGLIDSHMLYLTNIDHHDALGLGKDVLLGGDVNADSFFVLRPQNGQMQTLTLRVPYPLGFHARHIDGRIDDPNAGWKGRGMWTSYSMYTPWHQEGGKGSRPKVVKVQMRPNPLAK